MMVLIEKKVERNDEEALTAFEVARFTFVQDDFLSSHSYFSGSTTGILRFTFIARAMLKFPSSQVYPHGHITT